MKWFWITFVCFILICGCATIDPNLQLEKSVRLELINDTGESLFSTGGFSENAGQGITKAILISMLDKFREKGIFATIDDNNSNSESARLKFYVRSTSSGYRVISGFGKNNFEIKYKFILEAPDNKQLYVYSDEQDDSDMDDVIEKIANKSVKKVMQYYKLY